MQCFLWWKPTFFVTFRVLTTLQAYTQFSFHSICIFGVFCVTICKVFCGGILWRYLWRCITWYNHPQLTPHCEAWQSTAKGNSALTSMMQHCLTFLQIQLTNTNTNEYKYKHKRIQIQTQTYKSNNQFPYFRIFYSKNWIFTKLFFGDAPPRTRREIIEAAEKQTIPDFRSTSSVVVLTLLPNPADAIAGRSACKRAPQWKPKCKRGKRARWREARPGQKGQQRGYCSLSPPIMTGNIQQEPATGFWSGTELDKIRQVGHTQRFLTLTLKNI